MRRPVGSAGRSPIVLASGSLPGPGSPARCGHPGRGDGARRGRTCRWIAGSARWAPTAWPSSRSSRPRQLPPDASGASSWPPTRSGVLAEPSGRWRMLTPEVGARAAVGQLTALSGRRHHLLNGVVVLGEAVTPTSASTSRWCRCVASDGPRRSLRQAIRALRHQRVLPTGDGEAFERDAGARIGAWWNGCAASARSGVLGLPLPASVVDSSTTPTVGDPPRATPLGLGPDQFPSGRRGGTFDPTDGGRDRSGQSGRRGEMRYELIRVAQLVLRWRRCSGPSGRTGHRLVEGGGPRPMSPRRRSTSARSATDREDRPVLARGPSGDGPDRRAARTGRERRAVDAGGRSVSLALTGDHLGGQDHRTDITEERRWTIPASAVTGSPASDGPHAGGPGRDRTDLTAPRYAYLRCLDQKGLGRPDRSVHARRRRRVQRRELPHAGRDEIVVFIALDMSRDLPLQPPGAPTRDRRRRRRRGRGVGAPRT